MQHNTFPKVTKAQLCSYSLAVVVGDLRRFLSQGVAFQLSQFGV